MNDKCESVRRVSLRDVTFIIFSKVHVFAGIFVAIVSITAAVAFLKAPIYEAKGNVLVKSFLEPNLKLQAPTPQTFVQARPVTQQDINSEVSILKSQQLLYALVEKLNLQGVKPPETFWGRLEDSVSEAIDGVLVKLGVSQEASPRDKAVRDLQKRLDIRPITLSNMIEVTLTGAPPEQVASTLNTLLESYVDYHIEIYRAKGARKFYADQTEFFFRKLKQAENDLDEFKKKWSIIDIKAQNEANLELLKTLQANLTLAKAQISEAKTKVDIQVRNFDKTGSIGAMTKEFRNDNILEELVREMGPVLAERERTSVNYEESSPKYQVSVRQLEEYRLAYSKQMKGLLKGAQLDLDSLVNHARVLEDQIATVDAQSLVLAEKQVEYEGLVREVKQNEQNYLLYLGKTEEARIEEQQDAHRVSNIVVTDWAQIPSLPIFPKKLLMLVLAVFVGLIVGLAGASISYYLDHTIKTPEDLENATGLPIFASIELADEERR